MPERSLRHAGPAERKSTVAAASNRTGKAGEAHITEQEVEDIEARSSPRSPVIYEIVRRLGEEEMERPLISLW